MIIRIDAMEYYRERSEGERVKFNNALKWLDTLAGEHTISARVSIQHAYPQNLQGE